MKIFSIVCVLMAGGIFAVPGPIKKILLVGELKTPSGKGSQSQPVELIQYEDYLELNFLSSLNALTIKVANEQNQTVYQKTVDVAAGSTLTIDTQEWEAGKYTLLIADEDGGTLEGEFLIE